MLPMVATPGEAREFAAWSAARRPSSCSSRACEGVRRLPELVAIDGVDEVHIGLNDLALSLGVRNRWLALAGDLTVRAGSIVTGAGKRFGLGAVGRPGDRGLPVPVDLVYAEYPRTGATAALLSRSFFRDGEGEDLAADIGSCAKSCRRGGSATKRTARRPTRRSPAARSAPTASELDAHRRRPPP